MKKRGDGSASVVLELPYLIHIEFGSVSTVKSDWVDNVSK